ncbi:MAG: kelch repeat-containing protein [Chitinophagaceae bacterium]
MKITNKMHKTLFILLFSLLTSDIYSQGGLTFNANDHVIEERTSYTVFQNELPIFKEHLYINFKVSLWDTHNLGYVFTLTTNANSYSFNYVYSYNQPSLNFNIDGKSNKLRYLLDSTKLKNRSWLNVKFDFNLKQDLVVISIDGQKFQLNNLGLADNIKPKLVFGKNQFYSDVPHMSISDLTVGDNRQTYSFPLNEWSGNVVHTSSGAIIGSVENPIWLIDSFYYWKPIYAKEYNLLSGLNFDQTNQRLLIYGKDSILFLNCINGHIQTYMYQNKMPMDMILGKSIFNSKENKLYVYETQPNTKNEVSVASLDMSNLKWQNVGRAQLTERMHHHNIFYGKNFDSIYIFGGYGGYKYYNKIYVYNQKSDNWQLLSFAGDSITPRFLSASAASNDSEEIFLFGGYGNESGNQVVGGHPYHDLYRINLKKRTIKKCWSVQINDNVVPTNNLVLSTDGKYIYALCYPHGIPKTFLRLYKISVTDGSYKILGSPIPLTAERIETDVNLFLNKCTNELICVIQEFFDAKKSKIRVYSILYPPIEITNSTDNANKSFNNAWNKKNIAVIIAGVIFLFMLAFWIYRNKKKRTAKTAILSEPNNESVSIEPEIPVNNDNLKIRTNAIYLLGEFLVFDKKGINITHLFSPKIKQLFILVLLNSFESLGISSKKISNILWPDTEISKTKNIKGVTLNHLRKILGSINGIELMFSENNYFFKTSEPFFCDYDTVLKSVEGKTLEISTQSVPDYFYLICRGTLLKDMQEDWLDGFKNRYETQIVETLAMCIDSLYKEKKYALVIYLSKAILDIDPFNEAAFKHLLNSCRKTKGIEYCKNLYDQFAVDYEKSIGESYMTPLEDILLS